MSGGDDRDELLARADRLEAENRRLREELARPEPPPPAKRKEKRREARSRRGMHPAVGIGILVVAVAAMVAIGIFGSREHTAVERAGRAQDEARERDAARWRALVSVEPCLGKAVVWLHYRLVDPARERRLTTCLDDLARLQAEPDLGPAAAQALAAYADESRGFDGSDEGLLRWRRALDLAREVAVPALRAMLSTAADEHERRHGRDLTWWRIRVGLAYRELSGVAIDLCRPVDHLPAAPDPAEFPRVLGPALARVEELAKDAPIEVRRRVRDLDVRIEHITAQYDRVDGLSMLIDAGDVLGDTARRY